jgi:hypothetical protein
MKNSNLLSLKMSDTTPIVNENLESTVETKVNVFEEMRLKLLDDIKDNYNKSTEILRKFFLVDPKEAEVKISPEMIVEEIKKDTSITREMIVALVTNIITLLTSWLIVASKATESIESTTSILYDLFKRISDEDGLFKPMFITVEDKFGELCSAMNDLCANIHNVSFQRNIEDREDREDGESDNSGESDKVDEIKESVHPSEFIELTETTKVTGTSEESSNVVEGPDDSETSTESENFVSKYTQMFKDLQIKYPSWVIEIPDLVESTKDKIVDQYESVVKTLNVYETALELKVADSSLSPGDVLRRAEELHERIKSK